MIQYIMSYLTYSHRRLKKHLAEDHKISPMSTYLQEIVYGGVDGIVTTFAVVAGFAGAQSSASLGDMGYLTVLLFGLANLFADASSMGLGNLLSLRSEQDRFQKERNKELNEISNSEEMEKGETMMILKEQGFTPTQAQKLVEIYATNPSYWADFMMRYELQIPDPMGENPYYTAIATFISFQVFGIIPLLPFIFIGDHPDVFIYAILSAAIALFILGLLRWQVTRQGIGRAVGEVLFMGSISAAVAYFVGSFFNL